MDKDCIQNWSGVQKSAGIGVNCNRCVQNNSYRCHKHLTATYGTFYLQTFIYNSCLPATCPHSACVHDKPCGHRRILSIPPQMVVLIPPKELNKKFTAGNAYRSSLIKYFPGGNDDNMKSVRNTKQHIRRVTASNRRSYGSRRFTGDVAV